MHTLRDIAHPRNWALKEQKEGLSTFTGVFLPSFITMIGALLFLNLGLILDSGGLFTIALSLKPDKHLGRYYKTTMQQLKDIPTLCLALCQEDIKPLIAT